MEPKKTYTYTQFKQRRSTHVTWISTFLLGILCCVLLAGINGGVRAFTVPTTTEVYVTDTGTKYHREGCPHLTHSRNAKSIAAAENAGYEPCSLCEPDIYTGKYTQTASEELNVEDEEVPLVERTHKKDKEMPVLEIILGITIALVAFFLGKSSGKIKDIFTKISRWANRKRMTAELKNAVDISRHEKHYVINKHFTNAKRATSTEKREIMIMGLCMIVVCLASLLALIWAVGIATDAPPKAYVPKSAQYVSSSTSLFFHKISCSVAENISPSNRVYYETLEDALSDGLYKCSICLPDTQPHSEKEQEIAPVTPTVEEEPAPVSIANGAILYESGKERVAPLTIETQGDMSYLIKLKGYLHGETVLSFYVQAGETVEIDAPLGIYEIVYASGKTWYGEDELFGKTTRYTKIVDPFDFYERGGYVNGWTVSLYPRANGNLDSEKMDAEDF